MDINRQQSVGLIIIRPKNPQSDRKSDRKQHNRTVCLTQIINTTPKRKYVIRKQDKVSKRRTRNIAAPSSCILRNRHTMFSKIERGDRRAKRSQVIQMATYFKVDEKEMLTLWLADKVLDALEGEDELKLTAIETAKDELMDVNR